MTKEELMMAVANHRATIVNSLSSIETCLVDLYRGWIPSGGVDAAIDHLVELADFVELKIEELKGLLRQWPGD